jgi:hypothetical protein
MMRLCPIAFRDCPEPYFAMIDVLRRGGACPMNAEDGASLHFDCEHFTAYAYKPVVDTSLAVSASGAFT